MSATLALVWLAILTFAVIGAWHVLDLLLDAHLRGAERVRESSRRKHSAR
jgi:hypothetical protein